MLITFSGMDGAGKSTQIVNVGAHYEKHGREVRIIWSRPGYTPRFSRLKRLMRAVLRRKIPAPGPSAERTTVMRRPLIKRAWLTLSLLDLAAEYGVRIRYHMLRGRVVLCDRYLLDARMDLALHFPGTQADKGYLWKFVERVSPTPRASFLLMIPVDESMRRGEQKKEPFPDPPERLAQRYDLYQKYASGTEIRFIDATQSKEEVFHIIADEVQFEGAPIR